MTANEARRPRSAWWPLGWRTYLLVAIAALLLNGLVRPLFYSDAIDAAQTCSELEVAMYEAIERPDGLGTDGWDRYRPRIVDRYEDLSCTFDKYIVDTLGKRL